jgi:hypothetical protein
MKGKKAADKPVTKAYAGGDSNVAKESRAGEDGFKRGGKIKKDMGKVHGAAAAKNAGRKPRATGGRLMSSAADGSPRKAAEHY